MTREYLAGLVTGLRLGRHRAVCGFRFEGLASSSSSSPARTNRFDTEVVWFATVPAFDWDTPGKTSGMILAVVTRVSAVLSTVFNRNTDFEAGNCCRLILLAGVMVFVMVEIICWVIGITMTRNFTGAVHHLYEGTQRIMQGDFSHRIEVRGKDQLAELGASFNRMTENLGSLLAVAKEKERLQSEIEIASEVQNQLYPRTAPQTKSLRLAADLPARADPVSGDYYDYECVRDKYVAMAVGDVAGKGISAALLMATLQSSLRTQLSHSTGPLSTAGLVAQLNRYLYANTSIEKYSTLCLALYDETDGFLTYTNGGNVPPALVRNGSVHRLDVNGTVVGAFPVAEFGESRMHLELGDLLGYSSLTASQSRKTSTGKCSVRIVSSTCSCETRTLARMRSSAR